MIKSVFAATAALFTSAGAALAGPYVNVETNAVGLALTTLEILPLTSTWDYEGALGERGSYYVQGGIAVVTPDGGDTDTVPSGKAGLLSRSDRRSGCIW